MQPLLADARTYPPPKTVRSAAQRGLDLRSEFHRGGTAVGISRARDLAGGKNISEDTLRRMSSFFARHSVDKRPDWANPAKPSNGYIAWLLWGGDAGKAWADKMVRKLDSEDAKTAAATACPDGDCADTGWYGLEDPELPDLLIGLIRDVNRDQNFEHLTASGWQVFDQDADLVLLSEDVALDLAGALSEGCVGLLRRPTNPVAWIEGPIAVVSAMEVTATPVGQGAQQALAVTDGTGPGPGPNPPPSGGGVDEFGGGVSVGGQDDEDKDWHYYAIVDDLDTTAVIDVVRIAPGPVLQKYDKGQWIEDDQLLAQLVGVNPPTLVELDPDQLQGVLSQINSSSQKVIPASQANQPDATVSALTALVADRPPTVSPNPKAAKLRRYWSHGKGAAKIRWNTPGDFTRCVRQLRKYLGVRAKGYCANLHKMNTGVWPGSKLNVGRRGSISITASTTFAPEPQLADAIAAAAWAYDLDQEAVDMLRDGIYSETSDDPVVAALVAGAFPLKPPEEWFEDPGLTAPTPIEVSDTGQVRGHIATFDVAHIGLPGKVHAPKSRSGYAYFKTGVLRTASGKDVPVGQITLAGGHAPLSADAGAAVAHYDNTASSVADVNCGHDRYGIWVAGAVRPEATPEQVRALRASAPSGDWRPINGGLELVAICQVNVPGFPVARARVASGAVTALVAAGAQPLAKMRLAMLADATVADRLAMLEQTVFAGISDEDEVEATPPAETEEIVAVADPDPVIPTTEPVAVLDPGVVTPTETATEPPATTDEGEKKPDPDKVAKAREYIRERRREKLRQRVYGSERTPEPANA